MVSPLIHIGYHKTATSWLQKFVFQNSNASFICPVPRSLLAHKLIYPNALDFDSEQCRADLLHETPIEESKSFTMAVSSERLSGNPHSGGYDSKQTADRLKQVFPNAKILIVIREQKSMILSVYKQYVRVGGMCSIADYLQPPEKRRVPLFDLAHFAYDRLIRHYMGLFGAANVLVLPYELFRREPKTFLSSILTFASPGINARILEQMPYSRRENSSLSAWTVSIKRRTNFLSARDSVNPWTLIHSPKMKRVIDQAIVCIDSCTPAGINRWHENRLRTCVSDLVAGRYTRSNVRTSELINVDLQQYHYEMSVR
ncbi:MAG: sulfotransferase [Ignavibacteria bacterium]|nr:sulfotransferase [Ignavibacteria bacterium]